MSIDISVIVPHLDQHPLLWRLIESLDAQVPNGVEFEIIIIDNGSNSPITQVVRSHPRVIVGRELAPGPGLARNRGALLAGGAILAFIDADCVAHPNWIQTISNHFRRLGGAAVIGGDVRIRPRGESLGPIEAYESVFGYRFELYIRRDRYAGTGNLAMRREVFDAVGPFGGIQIAEDRDWGQRAARAGFPPTYVPEMIVYTEAREGFPELAQKWDRHIGHDFATVHGGKSKLRWLVRSLALSVSPIVEIPRVLTSSRIRGSRARVLAFGVLLRIRLHRSRRMLQLLLRGRADEMALSWRKK